MFFVNNCVCILFSCDVAIHNRAVMTQQVLKCPQIALLCPSSEQEHADTDRQNMYGQNPGHMSN